MSNQEIIPTVTIQTPAGPTRINASEFNEKDHKLATDAQIKKAAANPAPQVTDPVDSVDGNDQNPPAPPADPVTPTLDLDKVEIVKNGKPGNASKWIIVFKDSKEKALEEEFKTEQEAWDAAFAAAPKAE